MAKTEEKNLIELTDDELVREAKKANNQAIRDALFIGFLIGILAYGTYNKMWVVFSLLLVYFVYKLLRKPGHRRKELNELLKERGLK